MTTQLCDSRPEAGGYKHVKTSPRDDVLVLTWTSFGECACSVFYGTDISCLTPAVQKEGVAVDLKPALTSSAFSRGQV